MASPIDFDRPTPRWDGMLNLLTGLGDLSRDKRLHGMFVREAALPLYTLDALYEQDGLAAKVIDKPAWEMTREGFELEGVEIDGDALQSALEDKGVLGHAADLHRWGSHYGGAILGAAVDDGLPSYEPLDLSRVRKLHGFFVLDRHAVEPITDGFRTPEAYRICTPVEIPIQDSVIHATRLQKFCGIDVTQRRKPDHRWWGIPIMERIWQRARQMISAYENGEAILQDISIDVFTIAGLADMLIAGNEDAVRKRLLAMQLSKSNLRAIALDAGNGNDIPPESYLNMSRSVTGVRELVELFLQAFVAVSGIPRSVLLEETPGGLNTGSHSGELRIWYALCRAVQNTRMTPWVNWMLSLIFADRDGPTRGRTPPTWTVKWNPLWAPSEQEEIDIELKKAQTVRHYFDMGAVGDFEIRDWLRDGGHGLPKPSDGDLEILTEPEPTEDPNAIPPAQG